MTQVTAELLLNAYASGVFPMAESAEDTNIYWVDPDMRGIFPLEKFHLSKSLIKTIKKQSFDIKIDHDFDQVIRACAKIAPSKGRNETWINDQIISLYKELFDHGFVHTVECWQGDELVGGLYGVTINGVFCGESMFHTVTDASKVALTYLIARLNFGSFSLLDTQFITPHLERYGATEITREEYRKKLDLALQNEKADFYLMPTDLAIGKLLQSVTQIS